MAIPNRDPSQTKYTVQYMENASYDKDYNVLTRIPLGFDGGSLQRTIADSMAVKITETGATTYIGMAAPGSTQASAVWQCKKLDETSGLVVTYADGNADFDNVATDLTSLSYS